VLVTDLVSDLVTQQASIAPPCICEKYLTAFQVWHWQGSRRGCKSRLLYYKTQADSWPTHAGSPLRTRHGSPTRVVQEHAQQNKTLYIDARYKHKPQRLDTPQAGESPRVLIPYRMYNSTHQSVPQDGASCVTSPHVASAHRRRVTVRQLNAPAAAAMKALVKPATVAAPTSGAKAARRSFGSKARILSGMSKIACCSSYTL